VLEHEAGQQADQDLSDLLGRGVGGHQAAVLVDPDQPGEPVAEPRDLAPDDLGQDRGPRRLAPDLEGQPGDALLGVDPLDGEEGRAEHLVQRRWVVGAEGDIEDAGAWPVRWAALVVASGAAGLVAVGIAQGWLGVLGGDWLVNAGVLGLTVLAVGGTVAGLTALFGRTGAALAALLVVLVGNPLSGAASAPELLPEPAGAIGQMLPPGAGGSLLRSTAFFDGSGGTAPLAVLAAWVALGLLATWVAAVRRPRPSPAVAPEADPVPVP
jgi:hypothetical protein